MNLFAAAAADRIAIHPDDVIAFVGGADVVSAQQTGHLESLLQVAHPGLRCRNFGWEGDTVFQQPRDFNFPPLAENLRKAGATVIFLRFGRMESFAENISNFRGAYGKMLKDLGQVTPRLVLVTPVPFEKAPPPLPNLSERNTRLAQIAETIRTLGTDHGLPIIDLFSVLHRQNGHLTDDGLQLTPWGQGLVAMAFARELVPNFTQPLALTEEGRWENKELERIRQQIIAKNRLWFNYSRPQNWAFLGGDRTEQPSSRDHRDPKIRWFPEEMRRFEPLLEQKEIEITASAKKFARNISGQLDSRN